MVRIKLGSVPLQKLPSEELYLNTKITTTTNRASMLEFQRDAESSRLMLLVLVEEVGNADES